VASNGNESMLECTMAESRNSFYAFIITVNVIMEVEIMRKELLSRLE
jgi:hypothetical protein